jgi:sodium/potassium-transporting ATPase subunit alpha
MADIELHDGENSGSYYVPLLDDSSSAPKASSSKGVNSISVNYHLMSKNELYHRYETSVQDGLSQEEAKRRLKRDGPNSITPKKRIFRKILSILSKFFTGFCFVLWPAAIMSILAWRPLGGNQPDVTNLVQGIVLILVIFTNAIFDIVQENATGRIMSSISGMLPSNCKVVRDGQITQVDMKHIVVGDVVHLSLGDIVPADLRLIEVHSLKLDTSMLTGESEPISCSEKNTETNVMESKNVAFMGTNVVEGSGVGVVVNIGNGTIMGHITQNASQTKQANSSSALHKEINRFVLAVTILAIVTGSTFMLVWGVWLKRKHPNFMNLSEIITTSLACAVAYVPEGLALCVILTLTLIARKMGQHKVLAKSLMTVETLGCVNVICSDKTGTLTMNQMSVMHLYIGQKLKTVGRELMDLYNRGNPAVTELVRICSLCNRAIFQEPMDESLPILQRPVLGDASDTAMLRFAEEFHHVAYMRRDYKKVVEVPFNSKNKFMLTICQQPDETDKSPLLMMKGAAEIMVSKCSTILMNDGKEIPLTPQIREDLTRQQEELGESGERVLAVCRKYLNSSDYPIDEFEFSTEDGLNFPTEDLCLVGMIALLDKPRPEAADAVRDCNKAGIRVSMVTGDHPTTAVSIARMVGIVNHDCHKFNAQEATMQGRMKQKKKFIPTITDRALAITGADIAAGLTDDNWDYILTHQEIVFARTTPEQKLTIVKEFQKRKNVVAVTGDGVNDSPAMKQADVGVAMGGGSDVARNTADLILMDNNFASIIVGVKYGRLVYENLKKVVIYLLPAGTMCELVATVANVFFGLPKMISPILMIVHSMLTDSASCMTLIFEQPEPDLMNFPPRSVTGEHIVNLRLLFQAYLFVGLPQVIGLLTMWFWFMWQFGGFHIKELFFIFDGFKEGFHNMHSKQLHELLYQGQCVYFVALVLVQFGNLLSTRTRRASFFTQSPFHGAGRNVSLFIGMFMSIMFAIMVVHIPVFQYLFDTRTIPFKFWFAPLVFALYIIIMDEARKFGRRMVPRLFFFSW